MEKEAFFLHQAFADKNFIIDELELSYLVLNNNAYFPWVILIPKVNHAIELIDLDKKLQYLLLDEIEKVSLAIQQVFIPDKLNIATLGNIVPQLHIHIIARYKEDKMWPQSVFGGETKTYSKAERIKTIERIRGALILSI